MILRWFIVLSACAYTALFTIGSSEFVSSGSGHPSEMCVQCPAGKFANASIDNCSCALRCNCTDKPSCDCLGYCELVSDCTDCPAGHYTAHNASDSCDPCKPGYYANHTGLKECTKCNPGFICNTTGCGYCHECPAGTAANFTACNICGPGTYSSKNGSTRCIDCPQGHICNATGCTKCKLCPGGQEPSSIMSCNGCLPGHYRTAESTNPFCAECASGWYQTQDGALNCNECPEGKFCPDVAGSPKDCPTGAHCPAGTAKPIYCKNLFSYDSNKKKCIPQAVFYVMLICVIAAACLLAVGVGVAIYWNKCRRMTISEEKLPLAKKEPVKNPMYYGH